ncbi:F0F1 ATP synthase subunit epsilon [Pandoraea cepalis]|uniref:ATP synthase epsilon chain n=1 Tax=Pandoraea cepalis TaxID=2508294 RepID=A0AAW7MTS8_9BURK|nr:F0F1 ATP synthase subunit epsilon [Pandoraea cepalis]MDN4575918.1 F0F1 ATP synthase subunit epsilon [Pandoraea cepalis]MDN4581020.1 F0F1 ATP synthase subunit epsilon [Pandoraea cepalis]
MTARCFTLTITTPSQIVVDRLAVSSIRAEDDSGAFGVHAGHADLVTLLSASVVRWRGEDGNEHYCAIDGGVLVVSGGTDVSLACRDAILGTSLDQLETEVRRARAAQLDAMRRARVEQTRLHAQAVRQMLRYLRPPPKQGAAQ